MDELYLITGATGHLGSAIVKRLAELNKQMRLLLMKGDPHLPDERAEIFYGDICDPQSLEDFFKDEFGRKLIVVHCAGIVSISGGNFEALFRVNCEGTMNIVNCCVRCNVSKLIYVSSVHAIPEKPHGEVISEACRFDPELVKGSYAKTKAIATEYVLKACADTGLDACTVHPSGIIGPYDNFSGHMTALIIDYFRGRLFAGIRGGYDFVDVRDVAEGIISACRHGRKGECYILSNRFFTVKEILDTLCELTGKRNIRLYLPVWFVRLTAHISEYYYKILKRPPLFTPYSIYTLTSNSAFSHQKADSELGYSTREMKQTLADTLNWLHENGRI